MKNIPILISMAGLLPLFSAYRYNNYEPIKNFHIPWTIKFPQPIIAIDSPWPVYPYPPAGEDYFSYSDMSFQQELLIQSLNKALVKLNQLLAPSNSDVPETTQYPLYTKPEVLVEALNKAIDRLEAILVSQPPFNLEVQGHVAINLHNQENDMTPQITQQENQNSVTSTSGVSQEITQQQNQDFVTSITEGILQNEDTAKNQETTMSQVQIDASTQPSLVENEEILTTPQPNQDISLEEYKQPTMTPVQVFDSVSAAIVELNKLFVTLPDELRNPADLSTQKSVSSTQKPFESAITSKPLVKPFLSAEHTSNIMQKHQTTTESQLFTSNAFADQTTAKIFTNLVPDPSKITQNININNLFVSTEPKQNTQTLTVVPTELSSVVPTEMSSVAPTEISSVEPTDNTDIPSELPTRSGETEITTSQNIIPPIDIRFGENSAPDFVFPDEFDEIVGNNQPEQLEIIDLSNRFKENENPVGEQLNSSNQNLLQKPPVPPLQHFPNPILDSNETNLQISSEPSVELTQKPIDPATVLQYQPNRPSSFLEGPFPPPPSARPQQTGQTIEIADRFQSTTIPSSNLQVSSEPSVKPTQKPIDPATVLQYQPNRPSSFLEGPFPPAPTQRPQQTAQTIEVVDRFQSTTTVKNPYRPTHYYSTPISLEYKPTRPSFAPNPIFYPRPIMRPGTPWPASSTERTKN